MKARLWMIIGLVALLCGCKAHYPVAQESGKEDMAYLLFTSPGEYAGKEVTVMLDGKKPFEVWGIERSGFFNGREKWAKGFENQRV